ncbi:MAG: asparagine synthase-related protein [Anaerolineales bacterium]|jgi:asparagine synthase (glutamine-hydrolysing)|nr:asparagine synthase-related protein [Anaerolineales bacterium]
MSAIAGIASSGKRNEVENMLKEMHSRGPIGCSIVETQQATLGVAWTEAQPKAPELLEENYQATDHAGDGHYATAQVIGEEIHLQRDPLGVAPLYYGQDPSGSLCFASEIKGLRKVTQQVNELLPGSSFDGEKMEVYFQLQEYEPLTASADEIAQELRQRLEQAVEKRMGDGEVGCWLSGGLDSSTMTALAKTHAEHLHTFAAGLPGAPDLEYARQVAEFVQSDHHEVIVQPDQLSKALPDVIYHLESFDALLVRSSIMNYLVAGLASEYVPAVFSGEGGDELFAGYEYLKSLEPSDLPGELVDITARLHNTALQRVDRSAGAHGMVAHVGFLDPEVVEYAMRIPVDLKLHEGVEKWILRRAIADLLPESVTNRPKAKFWEGAGVQDYLALRAEQKISDADFASERTLPNGCTLNSKEELLYYRIFRERFGELEDLKWMGRTKGFPA